MTTSPRDAEGVPAGEADDGEDLLSEAFFRDRNVADEVHGPDGEGRSAAGGGPVRPSIARRLLPRLGLLVLAFAVIDVVLRTVLPPPVLVRQMQGEAAAYTVKVDAFAEGPAPDVLFLGSSRVRDGMVPQVMAERLGSTWGRVPRVYNLGLVNAKAEEWYSLVASHLPEPPPPYVIIGVTGSELVRVHNFQYAARFLWRRSTFADYLGRTSWHDFRVEHVEHYLESVLGRVWYLFGQRIALRNRLDHAVRDALGLTNERQRLLRDMLGNETEKFVTAPDGYTVPTKESRQTLADRLEEDPDGVRVPKRELEHPAEIVEGSDFALLRDIVTLLRERGSRVALVEMPVSPYLQERNPVLHGGGIPPRGGRGGRAGFRERVAAVASDLDVPWVPFPARANNLDNRLYVDVNHLTTTGARRYTAILHRKLTERGFFDEHAPPLPERRR